MTQAASQGGNGNGSGAGSGGEGSGNGAGAGAGEGSGAGSGGSQGGSSSSLDKQFDPSTLSGADLEKVLENKDLWKTPRMQELLKSNKELQDLKKKQDEEANKQLAEDKKWEDLAKKHEADLASAKKQNQELSVSQQLTNKLAPLGVVDLDAALKLIDRSKIEIADDGTVSGIDEAIESLKTDKTYLFKSGNGSSTVGTATNGNGSGGGADVPTFKRSQLKDPQFYQEHRKEILAAMHAGKIEDDVTPHR